ncbi:hypothetical protein JT358_11675 [Micrococcales bacterium 31B]|nr:hypothetical protein [Micrococcales bacterium 31B]
MRTSDDFAMSATLIAVTGGILPWQLEDGHADHALHRRIITEVAGVPDPGESAWTRAVEVLYQHAAFDAMHPDRDVCADCTRPVRRGRRHGSVDPIIVDIWPHPSGQWRRQPGRDEVVYRRRGAHARGLYREHILTCEAIWTRSWMTGS